MGSGKFTIGTSDVVLYAIWIPSTLTSLSVDKSVVIFNGTSDSPVQINVTQYFSNSVVKWESADTNVATVVNGLVTPVGEGLTSVTVKYGTITSSVAVMVMRNDARTIYDAGSFASSYSGCRTDSKDKIAFGFHYDSYKDSYNPYVVSRLTSDASWNTSTYKNSGWEWDINSQNALLDVNGNAATGDLSLSVRPVIAYDSSTGESYIVIYQILTNTSSSRLSGQKFGAHADLMLNDSNVNLVPTSYGASMYKDDIQFDVYAKSGEDCTPVDTLWYGYYSNRYDNIYGESTTTSCYNIDPGMAFSWQNIDLEPGETIIKSVRMSMTEHK